MFDIFNSFAVEEFDTLSDKNIHNAIFANGLFQMRKSPIGTFIVPVEDTDFTKYGLTKKCETSFTPDHSEIPKVPSTLLTEVIRLYREVYKTITSEVYCAIVWDKVKKDFFIHVPEQEVSAATISYENTVSIYNNPDLVVIMDVHSHNVMSAFFSGVDLADEKATRYFAVIGKINDQKPEMVIRAATNGIGVSLKLADVFDFSSQGLHATSDYTVPEEHYARVKELLATNKYTNMYNGCDEWETYVPAKTTTTYTSPYKYDANNPFTKLYNLIGPIRYGKAYNADSVRQFMETCIECAARYVEDFNVAEAEMHTLSEEIETLINFRFYSAILTTHGVVATPQTETEFTIQQGSENDSSTICI